MKFSILCPTRGRVEGAVRLRDSALSTADDPSSVEVLFYVDDDDELVAQYKDALGAALTVGPPMSVSKSWNVIAEKCSGDILMMGNDDLVYRTQGWDTRVAEEAAKFPDQIYCMWTQDGINGKRHCAFPIVSRVWYETVGYFSPGVFEFLYNDTWVMDIGKRVGRLHYIGDVLIEHLHFSVRKSPRDKTYTRQRRDGRRARDRDLYAKTGEDRQKDAEKLLAVINGEVSGE
jgi:hypothetical protein